MQCGLTEGQSCAQILEGQPCASMLEGDDAKFKVIDKCMETFLRESYFQCGICMTRSSWLGRVGLVMMIMKVGLAGSYKSGRASMA